MTQVLIGKELPNLKITLGKDSDESAEDGEISDKDDDLEIASEGDEKNVEIIRTWLPTIQHPKVYMNKSGGFVTGIDLTSESVLKKLEERAARFGLEKTSDNPVTQKEIDALYKSLGINAEELKSESAKIKNVRLDALHMRGVDEMSTNDVFEYFKEYGPASVEWINDYSCNVVWLDETSTARALLGMSRSLILQKKTHNIKESVPTADASTNVVESAKENIDTDAVILISDSSDDEDMVDLGLQQDVSMETVCDETEANETATKCVIPVDDPKLLDVPVPPGEWRLGFPCPKAKTLLFRFATKDDRKLPGAEKRSHYYQKYGNPNYGGLKGLISSSRKRKIQATRNRLVIQKLATDKSDEESHDKPASSNQSRVRKPRMRMYADEEEAKMKDKRDANKKSIWDRLGPRLTINDVCELDSQSSESDDEYAHQKRRVTEQRGNPKYNVWTSIAESMADEDVEGYRGNKFQRRSRDLRSVLSSSSKRQDLISERKLDLRSKLQKIRSEDKMKHRSPLCRPDVSDE